MKAAFRLLPFNLSLMNEKEIEQWLNQMSDKASKGKALFYYYDPVTHFFVIKMVNMNVNTFNHIFMVGESLLEKKGLWDELLNICKN